ncbi:hypothetical protein BDP81DRAFT_395540 [Colletotrichum phormii]|uniref:Uncharacterized protein n=1 Tax=Colletotrichum phormii TaxID=359342 RepID=A0AAI9ZN60_9PEZI|nr:uncharacterized protein BDP81DRAFT_395540 [Colletotrichum phormii]KAK1635071.1 hypothetical protein BDP81DRAFT_395540 [Colletotrichum phormii]
MTSPEPPQFVISGVHQLNDSGKRMCDSLIALVLLYNDPRRTKTEETIDGLITKPEIHDTIRDNFWKRVFADGWATDKPNVLKPTSNMDAGGKLPKRMVEHVIVGELSDTIDYDETKATYQRTEILMAAKPEPEFNSDFVDFVYSYQSGSVFSTCKKRPVFKKDAMNQPSQIRNEKVKAIWVWDRAQMQWLGEWNYERATYVARRYLVGVARDFGGDENGVLSCEELHPMEVLLEMKDEELEVLIEIQSSREVLKRTRLRLLDKVASFRGEYGEDEENGTRGKAYGLTHESNEPDENPEELESQLRCIEELAETTKLLAKIVTLPPPANIW